MKLQLLIDSLHAYWLKAVLYERRGCKLFGERFLTKALSLSGAQVNSQLIFSLLLVVNVLLPLK